MTPGEISNMWKFMSIVPQVMFTVICLVICLIIVNRFKLPKVMALFGLLGIFGIVLLFVVSSIKRGNDNYKQQGSSFQQNYNNYQQNTNPFTSQNVKDAYRTETIDSDNYQFKGGMNVCETHQEHNDTYVSSYEDVMNGQNSQQKSYNLNGENVAYGKGLCPHCGAKLRKFKRFCDSCGSRV